MTQFLKIPISTISSTVTLLTCSGPHCRKWIDDFNIVNL